MYRAILLMILFQICYIPGLVQYRYFYHEFQMQKNDALTLNFGWNFINLFQIENLAKV